MNTRVFAYLFPFALVLVGSACSGRDVSDPEALGGAMLPKSAAGPGGTNSAEAVAVSDEPARHDRREVVPQKSTAGVIRASGVNADGAYEFLDAPNFDERLRQVAAEGAGVPGTAEANVGLQRSLAGLAAAIDPQADIGRVACNGEVCVTSVKSRMDKAQWETWKAEFSKTKTPQRSATFYSPVRLADGSTSYRVLMVTKPGPRGINIPFRSIPTADQLRQQGLLKPKG